MLPFPSSIDRVRQFLPRTRTRPACSSPPCLCRASCVDSPFNFLCGCVWGGIEEMCQSYICTSYICTAKQICTPHKYRCGLFTRSRATLAPRSPSPPTQVRAGVAIGQIEVGTRRTFDLFEKELVGVAGTHPMTKKEPNAHNILTTQRAGRFCCNFLYYRSLELCRARGPHSAVRDYACMPTNQQRAATTCPFPLPPKESQNAPSAATHLSMVRLMSPHVAFHPGPLRALAPLLLHRLRPAVRLCPPLAQHGGGAFPPRRADAGVVVLRCCGANEPRCIFCNKYLLSRFPFFLTRPPVVHLIVKLGDRRMRVLLRSGICLCGGH